MESEVVKWLQRDVNCLTDPQRFVRKRSLEKLSRVEELRMKFGTEAMIGFFKSHLLKPLLLCISDPVEKCRELSIQICKEYAKMNALCDGQIEKDTLAVINTRLGKTPLPEPAEEIRLLLLELLLIILQKTSKECFSPVIGDVLNILAKASTDPFPDAKKACCDCIIQLTTLWKNEIKLHLFTIVKPMTMNLGHQHARVRLCTLQVRFRFDI